MIKSEKTVERLMRRGYTLHIAGYIGWILRSPDNTSTNVVFNKTAKALIRSGKLIRLDDRTAKCGEKYGWNHQQGETMDILQKAQAYKECDLTDNALQDIDINNVNWKVHATLLEIKMWPEMTPEQRASVFLRCHEAIAEQRLQQQLDGRAKRQWSDGRIHAEDDGDLAFAIGLHPTRQLVIIDFGKEVTWLAFEPSQAIQIAETLIKHAKAISGSAETG